MNGQTRAQSLLEHYTTQELDEARRLAGVARSALSLGGGIGLTLGGMALGNTTPGLRVAPGIAYAAAGPAALQVHVQHKYGLGKHIEGYIAGKQAIHRDPTLTGHQKTQAKEQLYKHTIHQMAQHVQDQTGWKHSKAKRAAHRALHGTYFGTAVI